jgi:hypothetical protein
VHSLQRSAHLAAFRCSGGNLWPRRSFRSQSRVRYKYLPKTAEQEKDWWSWLRTKSGLVGLHFLLLLRRLLPPLLTSPSHKNACIAGGILGVLARQGRPARCLLSSSEHHYLPRRGANTRHKRALRSDFAQRSRPFRRLGEGIPDFCRSLVLPAKPKNPLQDRIKAFSYQIPTRYQQSEQNLPLHREAVCVCRQVMRRKERNGGC